MRQGAIKSQSTAILDGVNQQLRALIQLAQLGVPLSWRQLGRLAQRLILACLGKMVWHCCCVNWCTSSSAVVSSLTQETTQLALAP